jgi:hypothetical protein
MERAADVAALGPIDAGSVLCPGQWTVLSGLIGFEQVGKISLGRFSFLVLWRTVWRGGGDSRIRIPFLWGSQSSGRMLLARRSLWAENCWIVKEVV